MDDARAILIGSACRRDRHRRDRAAERHPAAPVSGDHRRGWSPCWSCTTCHRRRRVRGRLRGSAGGRADAAPRRSSSCRVRWPSAASWSCSSCPRSSRRRSGRRIPASCPWTTRLNLAILLVALAVAATRRSCCMRCSGDSGAAPESERDGCRQCERSLRAVYCCAGAVPPQHDEAAFAGRPRVAEQQDRIRAAMRAERRRAEARPREGAALVAVVADRRVASAQS